MQEIPTATYVKEFLPETQHFLYYQLLSLKPDFNPVVISKFRTNTSLFKYDRVFFRPDLLESTVFQARRVVLGYNDSASSANNIFWKKVITDNRCRLIHAHFGPNGVSMMPLAIQTGLPLVVSFYGYGLSHLLKNQRYREDLGKLFKTASAIITSSEQFRKKAVELGCSEEKTVCLHMGVPLEKFKYRPRKTKKDGKFTAIQVSEFEEKRGHAYTLRAFKKVLDAGFDCRLVFAGDGPARGECERLTVELGIAEKVEFWGNVTQSHIPKLLDNADIFVHHSITDREGNIESTTYHSAEAMCTGMPVISTFHGGIPEEVIDGKCGFLVKEKDIDGYAAKWTELLSSPELIEEMGRFARKHVEENFDIKKQNEKLKNIYRKII